MELDIDEYGGLNLPTYGMMGAYTFSSGKSNGKSSEGTPGGIAKYTLVGVHSSGDNRSVSFRVLEVWMCHSISTCSTQAMIRQRSLFLFSTSHGSLQRFMAIITVLHSCAEGPHAPSIKAMYHSAQANSKNVRRLKAIYIRPGRCIDGTSDAQKWVKTFRNAAGNTCSAADGHVVLNCWSRLRGVTGEADGHVYV